MFIVREVVTRAVLEKLRAEKGGREMVRAVIRRNFIVEGRVRSQDSVFQI